MTLTVDDIKAIGELLDEKLDEKLIENFDKSFDKKFAESFDKSFKKSFAESFDKSFDKKFDPKIKPIYGRLDMIDIKLERASRKMDDLELDVKISERNIRKDIHLLKDQMETVIEVLKQHEMLPQ